VSAEKVILLLGRRDEPTDGVADYCEKLREAGLRHGLAFELVQLAWAEEGWRASLSELREAAVGWQGRSVLLQFTTLAWSRRGFPLRAPRILNVLRQCGAKPGVVFHDFLPLAGRGIVGQAREYCHLRVLRQLYERSDVSIFTVALDQISWLPLSRQKAVFIPVGANCPEVNSSVRRGPQQAKTVAVYSITGGNRTSIEVADIANALRRAGQKVGPLRLVLFGRGSREAEPALRSQLNGVEMEIESLGLVTPEQVSQALAGADVLLFVRGQISTRRGSAIAGIACGLPIVCYSGAETAWPITEAGVLAVVPGDSNALAAALETVLSDNTFRMTLAERNRKAHEKYFSWAAITAEFAAALGANSTEQQADLSKKKSDTMRVA
jgi:glycosyltransferase involved in cell wall biosynthesis